MKAWWLNASIREKQAVSLCAIFITFFLVYEIVFAPISNAVDTMRQKIHSGQTLLAWMQESDKRIQTLEKTQKTAAPKSSASLLSVIQNDVNNQPIGKNISQLQQAENDSIQIHLQKVGFDALTKWLIAICQQQSLIITQMTATPTATPGIVDADLKLQAS
jgi:type II secretory pathway component PulM